MPLFGCIEDGDPRAVSGLMFTSDLDKDKKLYVLDIDTVIEILSL